MRHILYKYLTGASMIALTFSLSTNTANATCSAMPTCDSMGYTQTSCPSGVASLKCPFDESKLFCGAGGNCSQLGYIKNKTCSSQAGEVTLYCPFDKTYKRCIPTCDINDYPLWGCDETYGTCSQCSNGNWTKYKYTSCISGVNYNWSTNSCEHVDYIEYNVGDFVYYENHLLGAVFRVDQNYAYIYGMEIYEDQATSWLLSDSPTAPDNPSDLTTCVGTAVNSNNTNAAYNDFNGESNTAQILAACPGKVDPVNWMEVYYPSFCGENGQINQVDSTLACPGKGKWWLPSSGEMAAIINNLESKLVEWDGEITDFFPDVCGANTYGHQHIYLTSTVSTNTNEVWAADKCGGSELFTIPKTATAEWMEQQWGGGSRDYFLAAVYVSKVPRRKWFR